MRPPPPPQTRTLPCVKLPAQASLPRACNGSANASYEVNITGQSLPGARPWIQPWAHTPHLEAACLALQGMKTSKDNSPQVRMPPPLLPTLTGFV